MFLKNCWYVAASADEFSDDRSVVRRILDIPVLMFRTAGGEVVGFEDRCPHRLVPLSAGKRTGDHLQCGYHGMVFLPDGRCVHIPGQVKIPDTARATTFPLVERYGHLWIWLGDKELVNADLIPYLPWPDLDNWETYIGYIHFEADYRLVTDNLLDLSHENYIHRKTIGNDEHQTIADFQPRVEQKDGRFVSVHREMPGIEPPPLFRLMLDSPSRINRWQTATWTAPAINMTDVGAYPINNNRNSAYRSRVLHLLTPETAGSTHYFWAFCRNFRLDEAGLTEKLGTAVQATFAEDKEMLELQQHQMCEVGGQIPQVAINVDDAPLRARRMLNALIRKEQEEGRAVVNPGQQLVDDASSAMGA